MGQFERVASPDFLPGLLPFDLTRGKEFAFRGHTDIKQEALYAQDALTLRIAPRNLFDFSVGTDNLLGTDRKKLNLRFTAMNITNKAALYNFLSTFSGTHFVASRTFQIQAGVTF